MDKTEKKLMRYQEPVIEVISTTKIVEPTIILSLGGKIERIEFEGCNTYTNTGVSQTEYYKNRGKALARYLYGNCPADFVDAMFKELSFMNSETNNVGKK
jgi:hypothetical protein